MSPAEFRKTIRLEVKRVEAERQAEFERKGKSFLGRKAILRQSPFDSPRSSEPRRKMNPRVKARDKWKRIERLQRNAGFLEAYATALLQWLGGELRVCFPYGTYWRCKYGGARVSSPP